ncbi:hypothetical protein JDW19_03350 [Paenibacillus polymyxa]|uniref:Copper amine oxidase n=1 Tax=Paenibacillus polymyxa TaxID=1406 RepID=A0A8I1LP31_PAEPO|nr:MULTISPECIES: hypothetical protein [Paenibacillus]KAF6576390.1 hypothetical protein G9G53_00350 [Paenibacillus sp. EKM206P]KAF6591476.1 hypothetical protein G9G52_03615 [Paenibacillus sp. EKM205P]MBM0632169.1 hypothetical protein [Paenibacillus polymyxa]
MNDKLKGLLVGLTIGMMITGATAMAASGTSVNAVVKKFDVFLEGTKKNTADGLIYNGNTYISVKDIGIAESRQISLIDNKLYLGKQQKMITENQALHILSDKIKKDAVKYNLNLMVEGLEGTKYCIRVYEDFPDHIATYGFYYVDKHTSKVTKYDIAQDKEVEI